MKKMTIFAAVTGLFMITNFPTEGFAQEPGQVVINVEGLRSGDGNVMLALMNEDMSKKDWAGFDPRNSRWSDIILYADAKQSSMEGSQFSVVGLPVGEKIYVYVFHDENGNKRMDLDDRFMPAEGFVTGGEEAIPSFTVTGSQQEITVRMTYL